MSITKKDTVILAALFNILILACILATARQTSVETTVERVRQEKKEPLVDAETASPAVETPIAFDEIDQILEDYIPTETPTPQREEKKSRKEPPGQFYTVKAGDNPWKIAKKFHLSFEKLLALNNLDEAKARNLKAGQKLRIQDGAP